MTLKKLASEKDNLVRINDILAELEKQVPTLERQSEKAKVFFKERDALKARDVNLFLLENQKNLAELESVKENEETIGRDLENARESHDRTGQEYEQGRRRLGELEGEIEQIRNRITNASVVREKIEGEIKVIEEQVRAASANADHFRTAEKRRRSSRERRRSTAVWTSCAESRPKPGRALPDAPIRSSATQDRWTSARVRSSGS